MRLGHADLRIWPGALFLSDHERDHPRQIRLEREKLQIEHERQVIFEYRRYTLWLLEGGQFDAALFLGSLDPALDIAYGIRVFVHFRLVLRSEFSLESRQ